MINIIKISIIFNPAYLIPNIYITIYKSYNVEHFNVRENLLIDKKHFKHKLKIFTFSENKRKYVGNATKNTADET